MANKGIIVGELVEVLYQWHQGRNISQIKRSLNLDRKTIRKYLALAEQFGFIDEEAKDYRYYFVFSLSVTLYKASLLIFTSILLLSISSIAVLLIHSEAAKEMAILKGFVNWYPENKVKKAENE